MKRIVSFTLVLVMVGALFTGCGCMDRTVSEHPGGIITDPTTMPTVLPTPTATHRPEATTLPRETEDTHNVPESTGEASNPTDTTTGQRDMTRNRDGMR